MGRGKAWWEAECVALCQAWATVSQDDPVAAAAQKPAFFERLHAEFSTVASSGAARQDHNGENRSTVATRAKWKEISRAVIDFDRHLRDVREEVGANAAATDDEYTVLMKAIARHNGVREHDGATDAVADDGGAGGASNNGGLAQVPAAIPARAPGKGPMGATGPSSFEFMSCWQFLRKIPYFWSTYVPDWSKRSYKPDVLLTPAREVGVAPRIPDVPGGESGNSAPGAAATPPPGTVSGGVRFHSGPSSSPVAKRMRTGPDASGANPDESGSSASLVNQNLQALTQAVRARNEILAEANALTLFSLENMRYKPQAQEYFELSAGLHLARMRKRMEAATQERNANETNEAVAAGSSHVEPAAPTVAAAAAAAQTMIVDISDDTTTAVHDVAAVAASAAALIASGEPAQPL